MRSLRIYAFRHGQTDWNAEGRVQGHLDVPLNDNGRIQARRLIEPLSRMGIQAILSSDLSRATETAEIVARELGVPILQDPGLREIFFGEAQGMRREEIEARFGLELSNRMRHSPLLESDIAQLGSESPEQVIRRAVQAITQLAAPFERIGVATHGGVIRWLLRHAHAAGEFPPPIANCAVYPMIYERATEDWKVEFSMPLASRSRLG